MAAHRYWRLSFKSSLTNIVGIGELQMHTTMGGANVASGGTPSASSVNGVYAVVKAFDGLTLDTGSGNAWASTSMTGTDGVGSRAWLQYDFGAGNEKDIVEIVIYAPSTGGLSVSAMPTAWDFQYSDDGLQWTTQFSYSFDSSTTAWALGTSRIYDVRPVGEVNIKRSMQMHILYKSNPSAGSHQFPYVSPNPMVRKVQQNQLDFYIPFNFGGTYKITGSTTSLGFPASRRVRLYHQKSGMFVKEAYTEKDGEFEFTGIDKGPWTVIGIDDTGVQNGVIYSHVEAVPETY